MSAADEVFQAWYSLSPEDRVVARKKLEGYWGKRARLSEDDDLDRQTDVEDLYSLLQSAYKKMHGKHLGPLSSLGQNKKALFTVLEPAVIWLLEGAENLQRMKKRSLFFLAAEAFVLELRWSAPQSMPEVINALKRLPEVVENAYPGYQRNGFLVRIAERVASGERPYDKSQEE